MKEPGCLHGTRAQVQDHIFNWLRNPDNEAVMWMYGPAGIGKTAIARTVARLCAEQGRLSSSFFFFRSDDSRSSVKHLVPTLVFEMLQQMPHMRDIACTPIGNNPLVFSASLERQITTIMVPALSTPFPFSHSPAPDAMLIIIDGLDECMDTVMQRLIIRSFVSLLAIPTTSVRHKILIVSRPEANIVSTFSAVNISRQVKHLCLDEWKSIADIEIFLRAELEEVKQTHPLKSYLNAPWPSKTSFGRLLEKSFESFAYATSAIRYISSLDRHPETSLNNLLDLNPACAYEAHAELDTLYRHIFDSINEKTRYIVRKMLCVYTYFPVLGNVNLIGSLLGEDIFVLRLAIIKMSSVIRFEQRTHTISYYHISFGDFLQEKERSGALHIYSSDVASAIAQAVSRLWVHPTTLEDYQLLKLIDFRLHNSTGAMDIHVHIVKAFLASHLPTTIVFPPNCSDRYLITYILYKFFDGIDCAVSRIYVLFN